MRKPGDAPVLTLVLGFGGLVPFAGSALAIMAGGQAALQASVALPVYGATILSFLAGGRWAGELILANDTPRSGVLLLSVSLSLLAWFAVVLQVWNRPGLPLDLELAGWCMLITGFIVQFLWDRSAVREAIFPQWYLPLRFLLTIGAVLSLTLAALVRSSLTFAL